MTDGWNDKLQRSLVNFLVHCPEGVCFLKFEDALDVMKDAETLCNWFEEMVLWRGHSNIVHIVTDNGPNYKVARRTLCEKYETITWSPCATYCLNLILKDMTEMDQIVSLAKRAYEVTKFGYNLTFLIAWLRKRQGWREIVGLGATHVATTFITLKSIYEHKHDLQAIVTHKFFVESRYAKLKKGIILDNQNWDDISNIVQVVTPLMCLLRIVDLNEKPSVGYVYDGMHRTRLGIKKLFKNEKNLYKCYTSIIEVHWDRILRQTYMLQRII
ncbi:DUF659 domain-containing protein [Cephalotus follicularis]|uniref:DUF659 domain-containing protein n=1 Tax=Cephalotus follicularis TaxID=3775 RepID=A0A1Q3AWK7_CEPFO|nr:DUF659 domain-containing protein [Cephalotus follicularis]